MQKRRIGWIVSLALAAVVLGACSDDPDAGDGTPPSPDASFLAARELAWDRAAQSSLRNSLAAAMTFYIDDDAYAGLTTDMLSLIEPSLSYVGSDTPSHDALTVSFAVSEEPGGQVYAAAASSASGRCFLIRDDRADLRNATTYGVLEGSACTGTAALDAEDRTWP